MGALVFFWLAFAAAVCVWAAHRGRSAFGWLLLALVFSPLLAAIFLAVLPDRSLADGRPDPSTHRRCPECAEWVLQAARRCKHCGAQIEPAGRQ